MEEKEEKGNLPPNRSILVPNPPRILLEVLSARATLVCLHLSLPIHP
jgi:hypothetical protein